MPITITDPKTIKMAHELAGLTEMPLAAAVDLAVRHHLAIVRVSRARKALRLEEHTLTEEEFYAKLNAISKRYQKEIPPEPFERKRMIKRGEVPYDVARFPG